MARTVDSTTSFDPDTSFLDVPGPSQRRTWRRPQTQQQQQSASLPVGVMGEREHGRGNRLRKKGSRLLRNRSEGGDEAEVDGASVDSRTSRGSSAVVVVDAAAGSVGSSAGSVPLGTRMSNWWSSLVSETPAREESRWKRREQHGETSSRGLLAAARQKAVGGVRYLLDGDAQPETTEDIWVRGVLHQFQGDPIAWPSTCESGFPIANCR